MVESDERFLEGADRVVELGPGAGADGGGIVFDWDAAALRGADTRTGRWLRARAGREPRRRAARARGELVLRGARGHNLRERRAARPLGCFTLRDRRSALGKAADWGAASLQLAQVVAARAAQHELASRLGARAGLAASTRA